MGVLYSAFPVDQDVRGWLTEDGLRAPERDGHAPTPNQPAAALQTLDGYDVEFNISVGVWQAMISDRESQEVGAWTMVNVMDYTDPEELCEFYFEE